MPRVRPVILSGGSGTRLWPLSTREVPKQFASLIGDQSLFASTVHRLDGVNGLAPSIVVSGERYLGLINQDIERSDADVEAILIEPEGRNTAPAVVAAALLSEPDEVLVILPSDHLISDLSAFRDAVGVAVSHAENGEIVTFGIAPTRPETGYGYIQLGEALDDAYRVARFKEKPHIAEARKLVADGMHLWNSGMFIARADRVLEEARSHVSGMVEAVDRALPDQRTGVVRLGEEFTAVDAISFDYAVMERTDRATVVPLDAGWDDMGTFLSLFGAVDTDDDGNHLSGDVVVDGVEGSFIKATSRRVVVAGLSGFIVVETPDAVLVAPLDRSQDVRELQKQALED